MPSLLMGLRHSDTVFLLLFLANAKCNGADASTSWFSFTNEVVFARARIPVAGSIVPKTGGIDQFETILNIRGAPRGLVLISFLVSPTRVLHRGSIHVEEIALNIQSIYFVLFSLQLLLLLWTSKQTNQQSYITNIYSTSFRCNSNLFRWYKNLETNKQTNTQAF